MGEVFFVQRKQEDDDSCKLDVNPYNGSNSGAGIQTLRVPLQPPQSSNAPKRRKDDCSTTAVSDEDPTDDSKLRRDRQLCNNQISQWSIFRRIWKNPILQKILSLIGSLMFVFIIKKALKPSLLKGFLIWMEHHPYRGLLAYLCIYPLHMVLLLPGTPLVMGAGFVFKVQYGWVLGVAFCSLVTLFGSLMGSVICFLLARYCIRSTVRRWSKKYPVFDPIDHAVSENGFRIMCLIYLTPVIPLGPMSYMVGTTSMPLLDFARAKIAALPLTLIYVYLGAATGTLITSDELSDTEAISGITGNTKGTVHKANLEDLSLSPTFIIVGILASVISMTIISIKMKKELQRILDNQKGKDDQSEDLLDSKTSNSKTSDRTRTRQRKIVKIDDSTIDLDQHPSSIA